MAARAAAASEVPNKPVGARHDGSMGCRPSLPSGVPGAEPTTGSGKPQLAGRGTHWGSNKPRPKRPKPIREPRPPEGEAFERRHQPGSAGARAVSTAPAGEHAKGNRPGPTPHADHVRGFHGGSGVRRIENNIMTQPKRTSRGGRAHRTREPEGRGERSGTEDYEDLLAQIRALSRRVERMAESHGRNLRASSREPRHPNRKGSTRADTPSRSRSTTAARTARPRDRIGRGHVPRNSTPPPSYADATRRHPPPYGGAPTIVR